MINSNTNLYCIIGHPVFHSKSPLIHNKWFETYGINGSYLAFDLGENPNFEKITDFFRMFNIPGANITIPYKTKVIDFLDEIDETAGHIGSVNTIKNVNGKLTGYNTDYYGVLKTLEINNIKNNIKTLIIGAGGATNAVVYALKKYGIGDISITNRTMSTAETLALKFDISVKPFNFNDNLTSGYDLVINTTPIEFNEILPCFNKNTIYFDLKYYKGKIPTDKYIDGKLMLLYQAEESFKIWTDIKPDIDFVKDLII